MPRDAQGCVPFVSCLALSPCHLAFSLMAKKTNIVSEESVAKMKLIPSLCEVISTPVLIQNLQELKKDVCEIHRQEYSLECAS